MSLLYVRKVSWAMSSLELLKHFSKYGRVMKVTQFYKKNGISSGKAKIIFDNEESRNKALSDKHTFHDRYFMVSSKEQGDF